MSVRAELVGRGAWEAAKFPEPKYGRGGYSKFLCKVVVMGKELTGIINVWEGEEEKSRGVLLIPTKATGRSLLFEEARENNILLGNTNNYVRVAQTLGVNFDQRYGDLLVGSLGGTQDRLGIESSLTVSNTFSGSAPRAPEPGDAGTAMGLAQHIMDSLPGRWQITPELVKSV